METRLEREPQLYRGRPVSALGLRLRKMREQIEAAARRGETKLLNQEELEREIQEMRPVSVNNEGVTVRKQILISIADLRSVSIECPHCRAQVVLDMKERSAFAEKHGTFATPECPACHTPYDSAVQPNLDNLQRAYQSLLKIADRIRFHGEPSDSSE